jgi:aminoglycoside phosphotransferase
MSKEYLSGHTNSVYRVGDTVVKTFEDLSLSSRSAIKRQRSEEYALRHYPLTPNLIQIDENRLTMSRVVGHNHLDGEIPFLSDAQRDALYITVGQTLKLVHGFENALPVGPKYHERLAVPSIAKVRGLNGKLGINHDGLIDYIINAYEPAEVQKWGITVVHGDYWLDNIIVKSASNKLETAGVIDWEMSGVGSPYIDFASVNLSIEMVHEGASLGFWKGYGAVPKQSVKTYFSTLKIIDWLYGDSEVNPESGFYAPKLALLRRIAG